MAPELESEAIRAALRAAERRPRGTWLSLDVSPLALISPARWPGRCPGPARRRGGDHRARARHRRRSFETTLGELRARGARIAIDDTGSGYAGLQNIVRVQPDIIKLDRPRRGRPKPGRQGRAHRLLRRLRPADGGPRVRRGDRVAGRPRRARRPRRQLRPGLRAGPAFAPWTTVAPAVAAELLRWSMEGRASDSPRSTWPLGRPPPRAPRRAPLGRHVAGRSRGRDRAHRPGAARGRGAVSRWTPERAEVQSLGNGARPRASASPCRSSR